MEPGTNRIKAIGYLRQSKQKLDSISFAVQEESIREHCRRNGMELVAVHGDEGISGLKGVEHRPGLKAALDDLRAGKASVVVVWRFSRISRNRLHQAMLLQELKEIGAGIEAALEPIDTSTAAGQFGRDILLSLAQMESTQKSETWKEAHDHRLKRGLPPHHRRVFGYEKDRQVGYIPNAEAELVRELYRKYIAGAGFTSLSQWLNTQGAKPMRGTTWNQVSVTRMMDNPVFVGRLNFRGEEHPGAHEPLISEETWAAYKKARADRATIPPKAKASPHWLSGVVKCGICGTSMGRHKGGKAVYRFCNSVRRGSSHCIGNSIKEADIDAYLALWLYARMETLAGQLPSDNEALEAARAAVTRAEGALDAATSQRAKLQLLAVKMDWSEQEVRDAMAQVTESILVAQNELDLARAQVGSFRSPTDDLDAIRLGFDLLGEGPEADEQYLAALRRTVGRIVIAPKAEGLTAWERISVG